MTGSRRYYDAEAADYDESRGGRARARAAAAAVVELVPPGGTLLDVAGGTGIVSSELSDLGWSVLVLDGSHGMLRVAADRLPGRQLQAVADRMPVRDGSVDVVTVVWLLHLLDVPTADRVLAEAARVLRPGGHLVTTVDKSLAHGRVPKRPSDNRERVDLVARRLGLGLVGGTSFSGRSDWGSATSGDPVFPVVGYRKLSTAGPIGPVGKATA
ncbi:class I SAM-dependent methyltransferase [Nocardioides mesophilus]|uniref:Class I SAM-dependent methyltransferase n=1 Tax=Nocardioides mesophilus TaxID=433659 RepID=A0A7G9R974_9ACTN|nr:class I SAM-dependent methyltransferase [Nocardioides mesophilus]QNN52149.1 class I SAM-dependent methyltransferase [Nocardioides mesophilus]